MPCVLDLKIVNNLVLSNLLQAVILNAIITMNKMNVEIPMLNECLARNNSIFELSFGGISEARSFIGNEIPSPISILSNILGGSRSGKDRLRDGSMS